MTRPRSELTAFVSDVHFDQQDPAAWAAFRAWHAEVKPARVVIGGDFLDFGMLSRFVQEPDAPPHAIPQIQVFVAETNALAAHSAVSVLEGNHDERWARTILGAAPHVLKGALGLSLHDQCKAHGLDAAVQWVREDTSWRGVEIGPFLARHGHRQSGRFGGGKHLAATRLARNLGQSEIFGHHHRAQVFCQSAGGRTAIAVANPCMTRDHAYQPDPDWQRGFTVVESWDSGRRATVHLIVMDAGAFAWGGVVYDGRALTRRRREMP